LRSLTIGVASYDSLSSGKTPKKKVPGYLSGEGLHQIGNNCTKLEELNLKATVSYSEIHLDPIPRAMSIEANKMNISSFLSSFFNLQRLSMNKCITVPPRNMQDWTNLRQVEGDFLRNPLWAEAISMLPNLKEILLKSNVISNENIIDFCNLCKDKPMCETLEVFDTSATDYSITQRDKRMSDDGLYSVLNTFLNLTTIKFQNSNITLTRTDIMQKLGSMNKLNILIFDRSQLLFDADSTLINEWLQTALPNFPKSLEIIQFLNCEIYENIFVVIEYVCNPELFDPITDNIVSEFHNILPNLKGK
jgi:hypothetical protein